MPALNLFVYLPEASHRMPKEHKIPLLVFMDQPDADIVLRVHTEERISTTFSSNGYGPFTKIVWIDGLKTKGVRFLHIQANKKGFDPSDVRCTIWRNPLEGEYGTPPYITYPSSGGTVPPNFTAYGTVDPLEAPCTAWLADGNGNTYPGMSIPASSGNWTFGFQNIPVGGYKLYVRASTGDTANEPVTVRTGP